MVPPPMHEISFKSRRSKSSPSFESQLTELNNGIPGKQLEEHQPKTKASTRQAQKERKVSKGPPLTKKNKAFLTRPHRRAKSLNAKRAMSESRASGISSLTSWTGSSLLDDSTASVVPTKPQDIFRSKSVPRKSRTSTPKAETRKQSPADAATPQRKNAGAPTNDATPIRHNRAVPDNPTIAIASPSPPPPSPTKPTSPSIPMPSSYSLSGNESMSTTTDSLLGNMTKRAVDKVMDNLLFEEDMQDYSVQSMPGEEEEDSYFNGDDDDKKEEASKTEAHPIEQKTTVAKPIDLSTSSYKKKEMECVAADEVDVTKVFKKKQPVPEPPVVEDASEEDSYFERDMDVSSLALEDAMSTLEKEQGSAPDHWHFNVRSLRHKTNDTHESQTRKENTGTAVVDEEPILTEEEKEEGEEEALITPNAPGLEPALPADIASIRSEKHALVVLPKETEFADNFDKQNESVCPSRADSKALPTPEEYDEVSLNSNKSKQLVVAIESSKRNASWWISGAHDEETGSRPSRSNRSRKTNASINPDEEETFAFRKTFMILFLIIGIAAITGGIAALVTSKHQNKQSDAEPAVQSTSPPRITPPPSAQATTASSSPTTLSPTGPSVETTVTTEPPAAFRLPTEGVPTASPTVGETPSPTIDHLKLTLRERIELFSPESLPALDNATTPQAQALEWALQQPSPSLEQYSLATLKYSSTEEWANDDGWLTSPNVCDWYGITCTDGKVTEIALSFNNLASTLPDELSVLTDLKVLSVSGAAGTAHEKGKLTGSIPSSWGERLVNLVALELYDNQLTGELPTSFQYMTDLEMVNLNGNELWGPLPTELGALSKLDILDLSYNEFSGIIPTETGMLSNLVNLKLNDNELTGILPSEIGNMKMLAEFQAQDNVLMGALPRTLYSLSNLSWLDLSGNELDGILPPSIGLLSNLEGLVLYDNRFMGPIPAQLSMLTQVRTLNLAKNVMTGTVPLQLGMLEGLMELYLDMNLLNGTIPDEICEIESLKELTFSDDCGACPCCTKCLDGA